MLGLFSPIAMQKSRQSSDTVQKGKEQLFFLDTRGRRYTALNTAEQP